MAYFFPFCLKDAFIEKGYFLCQKSLTSTEQIKMTPNTLLSGGLQAESAIPGPNLNLLRYT